MPMAQMSESVLVIKVSRLVRDEEVTAEIFDESTITQLEAVIEELVNDPKSLVEIIRA
jgi:hypothetical protein